MKRRKLKVNSHQAKAKISFDDCRIFSDLFRLFFDIFSLSLSLGLNRALASFTKKLKKMLFNFFQHLISPADREFRREKVSELHPCIEGNKTMSAVGAGFTPR